MPMEVFTRPLDVMSRPFLITQSMYSSPGSSRCRRRDLALADGVEHGRDEVARQVLGDEHDARAALGVGPVRQLEGRMEEVLHRLHDDRLVAAGDGEDAL